MLPWRKFRRILTAISTCIIMSVPTRVSDASVERRCRPFKESVHLVWEKMLDEIIVDDNTCQPLS